MSKALATAQWSEEGIILPDEDHEKLVARGADGYKRGRAPCTSRRRGRGVRPCHRAPIGLRRRPLKRDPFSRARFRPILGIQGTGPSLTATGSTFGGRSASVLA